jgi:hypothetical protein
MDKRLQELMRAQQAREGADHLIRQVSGNDGNMPGGTYLVSSFRKRDDLPVTASLRKMSSTVACRLVEMGLLEPVSLNALPNRWWTVHVDAAEEGLCSEFGGAFVRRTLSSTELARCGFEVIDGPFKAWETPDVSRAVLLQHPGKFWDARILRDASAQVQGGAHRFSGYDNAYTTELLLEALDRGDGIQVFSGPFDTQAEAGYALDLRWEVPE